MASRRKSRQRALQLLFSWDARKRPIDDVVSEYFDALYAEEGTQRDPFAIELARGTVEHVADIDERITKHAANWRMERMPAVDRNVLRVAIYEMSHGGTPAPVAIDEALELARRYSNEESVQFVNGVLDAVRRELPPA